MKRIFLLTMLLSFKLYAISNVENPVITVDNDPFPCTKYAKYCNPKPDPIKNVSQLKIYSCQNSTGEKSFVLQEQLTTEDAKIISFVGEDTFTDNYLKLKSKEIGFRSKKTIFESFPHGQLLTISESSLVNRAGDNIFMINAKLVTHEKEIYFSCN